MKKCLRRGPGRKGLLKVAHESFERISDRVNGRSFRFLNNVSLNAPNQEEVVNFPECYETKPGTKRNQEVLGELCPQCG